MTSEMFQDKKYKDMDWLAKACEPFVYSFNKIFTALPEEFELTYEYVEEKLLNGSYKNVNFYADRVILDEVARMGHSIKTHEIRILADFYNMEMSDNMSIDLETEEMIGEIKLKKTKRTFDDKDMASMMVGYADSQYRTALGWNENNLDTKRLNEIIELLELPDSARISRSRKKKARAIQHGLDDIMTTNRFNIKDVDLAFNFCRWVGTYIKTGNVAAFKNVCTLKIMTHEGEPIYSIAEEQI